MNACLTRGVIVKTTAGQALGAHCKQMVLEAAGQTGQPLFTDIRILAAHSEFPPLIAVQLRRFSTAELTHRCNGFSFASAECVAIVAETLERTEVALSHPIMLWRFFKFNERE